MPRELLYILAPVVVDELKNSFAIYQLHALNLRFHKLCTCNSFISVYSSGGITTTKLSAHAVVIILRL